MRALKAHREGQHRQAVPLYEQHLSQHADSLDGWLNLGSALARLGNAPESIEAFARAGQLAADSGRAWRDIGLGLLTVGQLSEARQALKRSVGAEPTLVGAWLHLARVSLETDVRSRALEVAWQATRLAPDDSSAHLLLARCLFEHDHYAPALDALTRAQQCQPRVAEAALLADALSKLALESPAPEAGATGSPPPSATDLSPIEAYADALDYWVGQMGAARQFSAARDTLNFAASCAPPGQVVELGVRHGVSLRWLASARSEVVHGFDSFAGLPEAWLSAPAGTFSTDHLTPDALPLPDADFRGRTQIWVGTFEQRLPEYVRQHPETVALLHVDSDLYSSAKTGLQTLGPLLRPGSVIAFDEYFGHKTWRQDEYRAFDEACAEFGWRYRYIAANPFTGQAVVQLV